MTRYFFCGIGGSGMMPLAMILQRSGHDVCGSDRAYDRGQTPEKFKLLQDSGIKLFPQDGVGVAEQNPDILVISSAVEPRVPDVRVAMEAGIRIEKRAKILADIANARRTIAVGGTSGKTTVTGMIAFILASCGLDPSMVNGGHVVNFEQDGTGGAFYIGGADVFVTELDESDGSIALFTPSVAVLNNISLDHKSMDELQTLFGGFAAAAQEVVIVNGDDPACGNILTENIKSLSYSIDKKDSFLFCEDAAMHADSSHVRVICPARGESCDLRIPVPGRHNISNALAALTVALYMGVTLRAACDGLAQFKGIRRRFEIVGSAANVTVIDDFGHNPDKIAATLATLKQVNGRLLLMFQPHGFGPVKMMGAALIQTFADYLGKEDILAVPEIYDAGGTADRSVSSESLTAPLAAQGFQAMFFPSRDDVAAYFVSQARAGDRIVIMGARDDTLPGFARNIVQSLRLKAGEPCPDEKNHAKSAS